MNETNKTLLERAAKAAEIGLQWDRMSNVPCLAYSSEKWNPLLDVAQAAELALLRSINVVFLPDRVYAGLTVFETYTDPTSKRLAYCRAVTRAAASAAMYNGK